MKPEIPEFQTKEELFGYLITNKNLLMSQKKMDIKQADEVITVPQIVGKSAGANKADAQSSQGSGIQAKLAINTCCWMDSHSDVHIPGIWKKSVSELKSVYLLQEHKMQFDKIISDEVKPSIENISWKDLGFDYQGETEVLVFDASIKQERNPFMFTQYSNGWVKNHSVGMRYVKLYLCINSDSPEYSAEKDAFDKYYPMIVNKDAVDAQGYFWAVTEAKIIEGSAVPIGSNIATPTLSTTGKAAQPGTLNTDEPQNSTQKKDSVNWSKIAELIENKTALN